MPMTYQSLTAQIQSYVNRTDDRFLAQIPNFIDQAMERIFYEAKNLLFQNIRQFTLHKSEDLPPGWIETISITYKQDSTFVQLLPESFEYCQEIYGLEPVPDGNGGYLSPKYYTLTTDIDGDDAIRQPVLYVFPVQNEDISISWTYIFRPVFNNDNPVNVVTQRYSRLLLYACLLEAQPFLKDDERIPNIENLYKMALDDLLKDKTSRYDDTAVRRDKS